MDNTPQTHPDPINPAPAPKADEDRRWRIVLLGSTALLLLFGGFTVGLMIEREFLQGRGLGNAFGSSNDFSRLEEVSTLVEAEYYYRPTGENADSDFERSMEDNAIRGLIGGLGDAHSVYLSPAENAPVTDQLTGQYEGIGVWVDYPEGVLTIVAAMPGGPAADVGLLPGDVLLAAGGVLFAGMTQEQAMSQIRGEAGTKVTLAVQRPGVADPFTVEVERRKIEIPAVVYEYRPEDNVAWIAVTIFGDQTTSQLDEALAQATADGAQGIVLDLRDNGGGWVVAAQEMVGRFVVPSTGPALYEDTDPENDGLIPLEIRAGQVAAYDIPLVVLVNGGTASAAEIVAAALQDYGRATIIGEKTFGKGSVQRIHPFEDGSSIRITYAIWLTPNKVTIDKNGIHPDIEVKRPEDPSLGDIQLRTAIEVVKERPANGTPVASPVASPVTG